MKRYLALGLTVSMLFLAACGSPVSPEPGNDAPSDGSATPETANSETVNAETVNLVVVSAGPGGTMYYMGTGQAKIISEKLPGYSMTNESTSGTPIENGTFVSERNDSFGTTNLDGAFAAYNGIKEKGFAEPLDNLRLIQVGHLQYLYMVTLKGTGIESIADIKGKSVALPSAGNTTYYQALAILEAYGLTEKDYRGTPMTFTEGADALKDGTVQVCMVAGSVPQAAVTDLDTSKDIRILSVDQDKMDIILKNNPSWSATVIPGGTYSGQQEDVLASTINCCLLGNADMDEEMVYQITKTLNENVDMMSEIHVNGYEWSPETTKPYYENPPIPFHDGAKRYYDEIFK